MPRIRDDFDGGIWAHRCDEHGRTGDPVWLVAGDTVPDDVRVSGEHLESRDAGELSKRPGSDGGGAGPGKDPVSPLFDPDEFTVDEVNEKLDGLSPEQVRAVIDVEASKRARHGIVNGPAARHLGH